MLLHGPYRKYKPLKIKSVQNNGSGNSNVKHAVLM